MYCVSRHLATAAVTAICIYAATAARADDEDRDDKANRYVVTNLVSDIAALGGRVIDPVLQNAWDVAFAPSASPFWVADNVTGCSTLYDGDGTIVPLQVKIPLPGGSVPTTACQHVNPPPASAVHKSRTDHH